mmetsp:Transcript_39801/g.127277  ORF Transcript_39801/g.127277 Transcript_39801/m.127277 type:complete len:463 (-) Transcript_39801:1935-3323(-)
MTRPLQLKRLCRIGALPWVECVMQNASDVFVGLGTFAKDHWEVIKMYFAVPPHVLKKKEGRIFTGTGKMPKDADGLREYVFKIYEDFLHGKRRPALDALDALAAYLVNDVKYLKRNCPKGGLYRIEFCHMFDSYPHELFENSSPFLQVASNQMCACVDLMLMGRSRSRPEPILRAFDFEAMLDYMLILVEDSVDSVLGSEGTFRKALVQGEFDDDGLTRVGSMMAAISTWEGMPYEQRKKGAPRWMRGKGHGMAMNTDWERLPDFVGVVEERGFMSFPRGKGALHMPTFSLPKTILEYIELGTSSAEGPVVTALALHKVYKRAALCSTKSFGFVCFEAVLHALNVIAVRSSSKHEDRWLKLTIGMTKGVHPYPESKESGVRSMLRVEYFTKGGIHKCEEPVKGSPPSLHASIFTGTTATNFLTFMNERNNDLAGTTKVVNEPNFTADVVFGALGAMVLRSLT